MISWETAAAFQREIPRKRSQEPFRKEELATILAHVRHGFPTPMDHEHGPMLAAQTQIVCTRVCTIAPARSILRGTSDYKPHVALDSVPADRELDNYPFLPFFFPRARPGKKRI